METIQISILESIENIHNASKDSKLNMEKYKGVENEIIIVSEYFNINKMQSIILSSFIGLSFFEEIELREAINYFGMEKIQFLPYTKHLNLFLDKNILGKKSSRNISREDYFLKDHLLSYISDNKPIPKELIKLQIKEDSFTEFLSDLDKLRDQKVRDELDYYYFTFKLKKLLELNKKYKLVDFASKNLELIDSFVFFDVILDAINAGDNDFNSGLQSTVRDFTNKNRDTLDYVTKFLDGKTKLNILNLVEKNQSEFANEHHIQLTEKAVKMLEELEGIKIGYSSKKNDRLIYPDKIEKSTLYYNPLEKEQLEPVINSMSNKSFAILRERLALKQHAIRHYNLIIWCPWYR